VITITLKRFIGFDDEGKEKTEDKTYFAPYLKARVVRSATELYENLEAGRATVKDLDMIVNFVVDLFGKQFTSDDIWDGLSQEEVTPVLMGIIANVINGVSEKENAIPNAPAE